MILQVLTVFSGVSLVLVVVVIKALIEFHGISCHLIWPFEERIILNLPALGAPALGTQY